jgi:hypothetical protein
MALYTSVGLSTVCTHFEKRLKSETLLLPSPGFFFLQGEAVGSRYRRQVYRYRYIYRYRYRCTCTGKGTGTSTGTGYRYRKRYFWV